jgi:glyoxylase-like metal-dependent hydrolase (beta-lactamase superfamily II)
VLNIKLTKGGIGEFDDKEKLLIWAGSYDKDFIEGEGRLPTTSLCRFHGIETLKYNVTNWADDGQRVVTHNGEDLDLVIYYTPGHTPDEIAIWDPRERVLFLDDTMYEWENIIFPIEGSLQLYSETLRKLKTLVRAWNAESSSKSEFSNNIFDFFPEKLLKLYLLRWR